MSAGSRLLPNASMSAWAASVPEATAVGQLRASTASTPGSCDQGRERLGIAATGGIADDVHRVVMGPGGRQRRVQPLHRLGCELGQDPALVDQVIGREDGEAAAVAQDGHARPLRSRGHRQDLHRIEELIEAVDTQHPGAAEHGLVDRIGPGHRARVRGRGARALGVATRLDDDGGFHPGGGPGRGHELAGRGHRLDVEQDGAGLGIAREVVEQIPEIHIRHVPQGDEVREADAALLGPVHHRGDDGPRLRDEGDGALRRVEMGEARVEPDPRDQDTEAIRADDAQEMGPRGIEQGLLALSTGGLLGSLRNRR